MPVDGREFELPELDPAPIVDVRDPPPGGIAFDVPLVPRDADFRRPFLELHRIATSARGAFDQLLGDLDRAVVVQANFGDYENRLMVTDQLLADRNSDQPRCGHPDLGKFRSRAHCGCGSHCRLLSNWLGAASCNRCTEAVAP